ncbi:hypothetical protein [Neobacillus niacini]|uniref:hypothetical protein n=1 Tax=Neobacillus niacini TaxID=86668 RepID=UPI0039833B51
MKSRPSLKAFLSNLVDYAGLFPPANLSINDAIKNYSDYVNSDDSWMLGPFIQPVTKLNELVKFRQLFTDKSPLLLSVVGRKSESNRECSLQLKEDIEQIRLYNETFSNWAKIDTYELPLPAVVPTQYLLNELFDVTESIELKVFCEVNILSQTDWEEYLLKSLDSIAKFNLEHTSQLGVKLRTGGIKAEMIPSIDRIAFAISACRDRHLPIKFTAGLHHPVRMFRNEVEAKMHGFLNVFLAGMLAYQHNLDQAKVKEILSEEDHNQFTIEDEYLAWKQYRISSEEIAIYRKYLCSFGSCSFDEPKDELLELSRQEVIK